MNTRRSKRVADEDDQLISRERNGSKRQQRSSDYVWELLDNDTKQDPNVAFEALARGLPVSKLPAKIRKNRLAMLHEMQNKRLTWRQLSTEYKKDVEFGLLAVENEDIEFREILWSVTDKDKLWLEGACKHPRKTRPYDWDRREVPACILTNPALIRKVLQEVPEAARILGPSLAGNKDYVESLLEGNPKTLAYFPRTTYKQYPKVLSVQASLNYFKAHGEASHLRYVVSSTMWADIKNSKDVFRAIAAGNSIYQPHSFSYMSQGLKADKEFVLELCALTDAKNFITAIDPMVRFDEDVLMAACARSSKNDVLFYCHISAVGQFESTVKAKMDAFEGFFKGILCGVTAKSGSALQLLDQGDTAIQRHIASYLDFPVGRQLGQLVKAARSMNVDGFHPYEPDSM